MIRDSVIV